MQNFENRSGKCDWPIGDHFIKGRPYVQCDAKQLFSDKISCLVIKVSDIWIIFRTMSEGLRQTESLQSDLGLHCLPRHVCPETWDH